MSSSEGEGYISPRTILTPPLEGDHSDPLSPVIHTHPSEGESPLSEVEFPLSESESAQPLGTTTGPVQDIASREPVCPGWNGGQSHNTHFKRRVQANFAPVASHYAFSPVVCATAFVTEQDALTSDEFGSPTSLNHFTYLAADTTDNLHYGQMLRDADRPKFEQAMQDEVDGLFHHDTLQIVESSTMLPNTKPLKRLPCWTVVKWKSRLCPHGGQQVKGINFWQTYAPVIKWSTVCLTLIFTVLLGYQPRQVDFVQAFSQADIDFDVYMKIPRGFVVQGGRLHFDPSHSTCPLPSNHVLKLKKNLYGLRQAGYNWHEKLKQGLLNHGFCQSVVDPCLFLHNDCILVVYVNDCLLFSKEASVLDALMDSLKKEFILTMEGDVGAFLGIGIKHHPDSRLELVQPGLIKKIISECGLQENSHTHDTPSETKILQHDPLGPPRELSWNYWSIVGMLTFLSITTRPDIAYAVHQCARFSTSPKQCHELAVRRIVCYLKGTSGKGYFLLPSAQKTLDCYVDADFAGNWTHFTSSDPSSVKSRTGYVILFANCPLLWASKLQTEVALSTTEAEYIALSQAMRDLIH